MSKYVNIYTPASVILPLNTPQAVGMLLHLDRPGEIMAISIYACMIYCVKFMIKSSKFVKSMVISMLPTTLRVAQDRQEVGCHTQTHLEKPQQMFVII